MVRSLFPSFSSKNNLSFSLDGCSTVVGHGMLTGQLYLGTDSTKHHLSINTMQGWSNYWSRLALQFTLGNRLVFT